MKSLRDSFKMRLDHTHTFESKTLEPGNKITKLVFKGPFESKLEIPMFDLNKYKDFLFCKEYDVEITIKGENDNENS